MSAAEPTSPNSPEQSQRRERAAIAAQACETCRSRKSKYDEQRPKCSLCRRLNLDCKYREPLPTKKDKSLDLILASLNRVETKVDAIGHAVAPEHSAFEGLSLAPVSRYALSTSPTASSQGVESQQTAKVSLRQGIVRRTSKSRSSRPYKVILWPAIYMRLRAVGVNDLDVVTHNVQEGKPWLLRLEFARLVQHTPLARSLSARAKLPSLTASGLPHYAEHFPELTQENLVEYANAYFDSYNILFPLFERREFMENRLPIVIRRGFGYDDPDATIVLGIAALGKMADKGIVDDDLLDEAALPDSYSRPIRMPGADIFNAFHKRVGGMATGCAIEIIQITLLQALYYGASGRYINAWRSVGSASQAVQLLISCTNIDWTSIAGVSISKAYWICFLLENWYSMDLDLPRIVLSENLESEVPLSQSKLAPDSPEEQVDSAFLSANVTLCRLSMKLRDNLSTAFASDVADAEFMTDERSRQMQDAAARIEDWRAQLPAQLSWTDEDRLVLRGRSASSTQAFRFTITPAEPLEDPDRWIMVIAQLRTRFYFIRSWIFQPYIYQALHLPEEVKRESGDEIARCLQDMLLAPIAMYPCRIQKRLVPDLFSRSSNFLNSLLILKLLPESEILNAIAQAHLDENEYRESIRMYLHWLNDMKAIDSIAAWSWEVLPRLFPEYDS